MEVSSSSTSASAPLVRPLGRNRGSSSCRRIRLHRRCGSVGPVGGFGVDGRAGLRGPGRRVRRRPCGTADGVVDQLAQAAASTLCDAQGRWEVDRQAKLSRRCQESGRPWPSSMRTPLQSGFLSGRMDRHVVVVGRPHHDRGCGCLPLLRIRAGPPTLEPSC